MQLYQEDMENDRYWSACGRCELFTNYSKPYWGTAFSIVYHEIGADTKSNMY